MNTGSSSRNATRSRNASGYAIVFVLVFGVVLATLSAILLYATSRDRTEGVQQENAVRSLYAAEAGVAVGISLVAEELRSTPTPDVTALTAVALGQLATAAPQATFPEYSIKYILNKDTGASSTLPPVPAPVPTPLTTGTYRGLVASQMPIQVLASSSVGNAHATIADAVQVNLIPIFQFAIFMDGPIEYFFPEPSTVTGRIHSNTGFFFAAGADDIDFLKPTLTTPGRIHLRAIDGVGSQTAGRAPGLDTNASGGVDTTLPCDDAAAGAVGCPGGLSWLNFTTANLPFIRDQAHGAEALSLPTGVDPASFTAKVVGVPDTCGVDEATKAFVTAPAGFGAPLSPDWQIIDLPAGGDSAALKQVKYGHRAGIRVLDGVWTRRNGSGTYDPWFQQSDPSTAEAQCVYYGYDPATGNLAANSDGVPAIQDQRFWDFQDRRMRRTLVVDVHRLNRCLPFLDSAGFNGIVYFGEDMTATVDNWGLDPDDEFYQTDASNTCDANFLNLPHYLRGQTSTAYGFTAPVPGYLRNDDVALASTHLDNPYYPADAFCAPMAGRVVGLGDGPLRLPQGNGDGIRDRGRNELVENGVVIRDAQRLPNLTTGSRERGFTFATNVPAYLQGDINTQVGAFSATRAGYAPGRIPGSLASDAVTFLSDKYNLLLGNPFAPVGPLAVLSSAAGTEQNVGGTAWRMLDLAKNAAVVPAATNFEPTATGPASPAPCSNLLRELLLRRRLGNGEADSDNPAAACGATDNCGLNGLIRARANGTLAFNWGATVHDWSRDLRDASDEPLCVDGNANGCDAAESLLDTFDMTKVRRANNAFVAFAPLEAFVDVDMFKDQFTPTTAGFSSRANPTRRNDREAVRDWMRCTLNSQHFLADTDDDESLEYGGNEVPGVLLPAGRGSALQRGVATVAADASVAGMLAGGGAAFDVTYKAILGSNGWAPADTSAIFRTGGGDTIFSRDRSGLNDPNGSGSPVQIDDNLGNLAAAASGDQLAINLSILTGTTWRCPNEQPFPAYNGGNNMQNDSYGVGAKGARWADASLDEGVYGIFRYQESWWELNRSSTAQGAGEFIDFFVNGSVVVMFYSREANGKHIVNQGYHPNMFGGCSGQDNNQQSGRDCRLNPGFEYAWESSHRSIKYDPANDAPGGMAPGVPMVVSTDRLRWVRR